MNWNIPKIWKDGECWIIGGGPSLVQQFDIPEEIVSEVRLRKSDVSVYSPYLSAIHDKHVIGVNMAYKLGPWIDFIIMGDNRFYLNNQVELHKHPAIKVGCNPNSSKYACPFFKYVPRSRKSSGITDKGNTVSWNGNTGAAAINLAYHFGAVRIILLGFDMDIDQQGNQHWHNLYKKPDYKKIPRNLPFNRHKKGFLDIKKDAKRLGIEIINASPTSTISEFKKCSVKDLLYEKVETGGLVI